MPRLTSVAIRRFKRLAEIDVPLGDVTLLIGANNAGKSSILQAIHFAVSIAQTAKLVGEGVVWRNDTFELSFNPSQLLYSPVADVMALATGGVLQEPRPTQIEVEFVAENGDRCTVGLRRGRNRNIAVSIQGREIGEHLMSLPQPFTVYAPGLAGIAKEERYLSPGVVRRTVARGDANLVLRNVLRMLAENEAAWESFTSDMRTLFDGISITIEFDEATDEAIDVFFEVPGSPRLPVDAAGTSVLQASQILAYTSLFKPQVLILDEPDSHLHPDNQRILCELVLTLASERGFQAIVSTHSRHVLDSLRNRCSVIWLSKGNRIDEPDLNTTSVLMDLGALDSVDYFADGELRCVVATEDANKDALKALLWSNGFAEHTTEVASYTGCTKTDAALVLAGFLRSKAPHVRLVLHRDRDYMSDPQVQAFETRLNAAQVYPLVTQSNDVECYFIDAAHLHALNPAVSLERIEELIDRAALDTREKSIAAIVNQRTADAFKVRQTGGGPPDHGQIAVRAVHDYDAAPRQMMRGKPVIGRLAALLQEELAANPRIFFQSAYLVRAPIRAIVDAMPAAQ